MTYPKSLLAGAAATSALLIAAAANASEARLVPSSAPQATILGGSEESTRSLAELDVNSMETRTIRQLKGPAKPVDEFRHSIHTYKPTADELPGVDGYLFRSSIVEVAPGGIVPIHAHDGRPAFLEVISGAIWQHRSDGASVEMKKGDVTFASDKVAHWWENKGKDSVSVWVVDLCQEGEHLGCETLLKGGAVQPTFEKTVAKEPSGDGKASPRRVGAIELSEEFESDVGNRVLRFREVTFPKNAPRPVHEHTGRPNYFMVMKGTFLIHGPMGEQRLVPGDIMLEEGAGNRAFSVIGDEEVVLHAVDIFDPGMVGGSDG